MSALPIVVVWGLKATLIFLLAGLAALALRWSSAARRHFVWTLAIASALALPFAAAVAPGLAVHVLPPATVGELPADPDVVTATEPITPPAAEAALGASPPATAAAISSGEDGGGLPWIPESLWMVWAVGAVAMAWLVAASVAGTAALARCAHRADDQELAREFDEARRALGVGPRTRLLIGRGSAMPMTWGALRPVVLVPADALSWSATRRRAVFLHELAHIRRRDWLTQIAARLACALYWWHPLVWLAASRLRAERELACDDLVLQHGTHPPDYASQLLELARWLRPAPATSLAGVAMARPAELAGRLLAVLDSARARAPVSGRVAISGGLIAAGLLIPVGGVRFARAAAPSEPAASATGFTESVPSPRNAALPASRPRAAYATGSEPWASRSEPIGGQPAPMSFPAARQADQRPGTLCDWLHPGNSQSSSTNIDDADATIRIVVDGCELFVRSRGRVEFSDDDRTVSRVASNGYFEIEERRDRERRRVEFDSRSGDLDRRWYVNGSEQAWSGAADEWLHGALLAMFRRTSFEARARAERVHRRAGKQGLLDEIASLHSSSALGTYFTVLFERERVGPEEARRLAELAGERIQSSSVLGNVLVAIVMNAGVDEPTRAAIVRSAARISSSSERARVLVAAVETAALSPALADAVLETAAGISSSSEKARVLIAVNAQVPTGRALPPSYVSTASGIGSSSELARVLVDLLQRSDVSSEQVATVLRVVPRISSSSEKGRVLRVAVERHGLDERTRAPFFEAVGGISSSSERETVLRTVTESGPDPASVGLVIDAAKQISGSSSRANVLVGVARAGLLTTDGLRAGYRDAAQGISSPSERERALRALGAA